MTKRKERLVEIVSQERRVAKVNLVVPIQGYHSGYAPHKPEEVLSLRAPSLQTPPVELASLLASDPVDFTRVDPQPKAEDFIYPRFRALSATLIPGYWLDYTGEGVLEAAVPMFVGKTVYKNHDRWDVEKYLGVVTQAVWDPTGEEAGGLPGVNIEQMIDWRMNIRIARGLLMRPPAIHSTSTTLLFEFDYSHPKLVEDGLWWRLLGQEVEGSIVRFIVMKILEIWEQSLVPLGADRGAKQLPGWNDEEEEDTDNEQLQDKHAANPPSKKETKTVKLSAELKTKYGIVHEGDDVPDEIVAAALQRLSVQASDGQQLMEAARIECRRVARLAILGAAEGTLPEAVETTINTADAKTLDGLTEHYRKDAADRFPEGGRSSVEGADAVHQAGNVQTVKATRSSKHVPIY